MYASGFVGGAVGWAAGEFVGGFIEGFNGTGGIGAMKVGAGAPGFNTPVHVVYGVGKTSSKVCQR
jgi:hypothetical protein